MQKPPFQERVQVRVLELDVFKGWGPVRARLQQPLLVEVRVEQGFHRTEGVDVGNIEVFGEPNVPERSGMV